MLDSTPKKQIDGTLLPFFEGFILRELLEKTMADGNGHRQLQVQDVITTHTYLRSRNLNDIRYRISDCVRSVAEETLIPVIGLHRSAGTYKEEVMYVASPLDSDKTQYNVTLVLTSILPKDAGHSFDGAQIRKSELPQRAPSGKEIFSHQEALDFLQALETDQGLIKPEKTELLRENPSTHWSRLVVHTSAASTKLRLPNLALVVCKRTGKQSVVARRMPPRRKFGDPVVC